MIEVIAKPGGSLLDIVLGENIVVLNVVGEDSYLKTRYCLLTCF